MLQTRRQLHGADRVEIELGPDRSKQLRDLMNSGKPVTELVKVVQEEWKVLTDHKPSTVRTMLYRYSRHVVQAEVAARIRESVKVKGTTSCTTMEDMAEMVGLQKARVLKVLAMEERSPLLLRQAHEEVRLMSDMLRNLAVVQIEVGILPRAPKTVKGVLMGEDGRPTVFGWVENDDALLNALTKEIEGTVEPESDDPV